MNDTEGGTAVKHDSFYSPFPCKRRAGNDWCTASAYRRRKREFLTNQISEFPELNWIT